VAIWAQTADPKTTTLTATVSTGTSIGARGAAKSPGVDHRPCARDTDGHVAPVGTHTVINWRNGQAAIRRAPLKPAISGATLTTSPEVGACTISPLPM
jgi:hypothetical protein